MALSFFHVLMIAIIVPFAEWERNPRLQAETLVGLRYGALPEIEPYSIRRAMKGRLMKDLSKKIDLLKTKIDGHGRMNFYFWPVFEH